MNKTDMMIMRSMVGDDTVISVTSRNPPKWTGTDIDYRTYLKVVRRMRFERDEGRLKNLQERYELLRKNWEYPDEN